MRWEVTLLLLIGQIAKMRAKETGWAHSSSRIYRFRINKN